MDRVAFEDLVRFFFRVDGRISPREYRLGVLLIVALDCAALSLVLGHGAIPPPLVLVVVIASLPLAVAQFVIVAKRCHDFGLPGAFCILILVPLFGVFWLFALMFLRGSPDANRYGPPVGFRSD